MNLKYNNTLKKNKLNFKHIKKAHSFHNVDPSPWPIIAALGALILTFGFVLYLHNKQLEGFVTFQIGLLSIIYMIYTWWRDVTRKTVFENKHTYIIKRRLLLSFSFFIIVESVFYLFFWEDFIAILICNYSGYTGGFKHKINFLLLGLILLSNLIITINIFKKFAYIIPEFFIICLTVLLFNAQYCLCDPDNSNKILAFTEDNEAFMISLCKILCIKEDVSRNLSISELSFEIQRILHFDRIFDGIAPKFSELWNEYNYYKELGTKDGDFRALQKKDEFDSLFTSLYVSMLPYGGFNGWEDILGYFQRHPVILEKN